MSERLDAHEDVLRRLIAIAETQGVINEDLRAMLANHDDLFRQQVVITDRLTVAIEGLETTQARIETLLAWPGENGREV